MSAKEMFEELNFMYSKTDYGFSYDNYNTESGWLRTVMFDLKNKTYEIMRANIYWNVKAKYTRHKKLDEAINKQVEELGWGDK